MRNQLRAKLAKLLRETKGTVSAEQAAASLGVTPREAAKTLARWARQGRLSRVRRGLYVPVPLEAGTGDVALEEPWIIAERLFNPCYVGGWSAAEHWGLTEQIFRSVLVMTTKKPRKRKLVIKGTTFVLRTIQSDSFFGTKPVWRGQVKVNVSDSTRTVLDILDDPALGGGARPMTDVFRNYLGSKSKDLPLLISYAERLGHGAVDDLLPQTRCGLGAVGERGGTALRGKLRQGLVQQPGLIAHPAVDADQGDHGNHQQHDQPIPACRRRCGGFRIDVCA
jgi:predicted transcriptional regulator of viral defense system